MWPIDCEQRGILKRNDRDRELRAIRIEEVIESFWRTWRMRQGSELFNIAQNQGLGRGSRNLGGNGMVLYLRRAFDVFVREARSFLVERFWYVVFEFAIALCWVLVLESHVLRFEGDVSM